VVEAPARAQRALAQVQVDRRRPKLAAHEAAQAAGVALGAEPGALRVQAAGERGGVLVVKADAAGVAFWGGGGAGLGSAAALAGHVRLQEGSPGVAGSSAKAHPPAPPNADMLR
jgi:hypothetical protein